MNITLKNAKTFAIVYIILVALSVVSYLTFSIFASLTFIFVGAVSIALLVFSILLIIFASKYNLTLELILFIIGIFISLVGLIGAIILLVKIDKVLRTKMPIDEITL